MVGAVGERRSAAPEAVQIGASGDAMSKGYFRNFSNVKSYYAGYD